MGIKSLCIYVIYMKDAHSGQSYKFIYHNKTEWF